MFTMFEVCGVCEHVLCSSADHVCVCVICVAQFRVNEFGVLEVITDDMDEEKGRRAHATTTWTVPTAQEGKTHQNNLMLALHSQTDTHTP